MKKFPSSYYNTYVIECFGFTREPDTLNYALVLKLKDCSLRSHLDKNYNSLTLKDKLDIIIRICLGLDCIHNHNVIHRDFHLGNILYSSTNDKKKFEISISDFGFCKPAFEPLGPEDKKLYGVLSYMAPEIWARKGHIKKSDIYSFGIIINEIISGNRPYQNIQHNFNLAIGICHGSRPNIRPETPEPLKKLIQKCQDFIYAKNDQGSYNFKKFTEQYEKLYFN